MVYVLFEESKLSEKLMLYCSELHYKTHVEQIYLYLSNILDLAN